MVFPASVGNHACKRNEGADVYQEIMRDVYKSWLEEFDHEAAFRRNLPRRERESRLRSGLARLRGRGDA